MKELVIMILLLNNIYGFSQKQDSLLRIKYTPDFNFKDGIYLNFNQVKNNSPLPIMRIISNYDCAQSDFFELILKNESISFYDDNGVKQIIEKTKIWGYSKNGVIFVKVENGYNRVTIVGAICHFVAVVTDYEPQYYSNPYYNSYNYQNIPVSRSSKEMKQFIIDFKTGNIMDYNTENIETLLMQDQKLYDEYISLKKKDKKKLKFVYIRKFNENNPIYLPI